MKTQHLLIIKNIIINPLVREIFACLPMYICTICFKTRCFKAKESVDRSLLFNQNPGYG